MEDSLAVRFLHIRSRRQVVVLTILLTLFCTAAAVGPLATLLAFIPAIPAYHYWAILAVTAAIPLLIAPVVGFIALTILRMLALTIEKVDHYVRFDNLTGVLTRAYFLGKARDSLARGGAFLMVDADHFKSVNDTYGHDVGDEALKCLATVLMKTIPAQALTGRLGGEEFGVFLPGASPAEARRVAGALNAAMRDEGKVVADRPLNMTVSIGIDVLATPPGPLEQSMKRADEALYRAKRSGRDRFVVAGEELGAAALAV